VASLSKVIPVSFLKLILYQSFQNHRLGLGTHLFVKVHRPGDSKETFSVFESSYHLLQSNHSKVEVIPLSALPKDTTSELASLSPQ